MQGAAGFAAAAPPPLTFPWAASDNPSVESSRTHPDVSSGEGARRRRYDLVAFGLLFLLLAGYFLFAYATAHVRQLRASREYLPVSGAVLSSEVVERGGPSASRGTSYSPRIVVRYEVARTIYESDRYSFAGTGWRDRASAQSVVDRFPPGSATQVLVDPEDPASAVLDATPPGSLAFWLIGVLVTMPLGLVVYGLGFWPRRR